MSDTEKPWLRQPETWVQLATLVGATVAFALGLGEYRDEQRWRRLGLFHEQLTAFEGDPAIRNALTALEYREPSICQPEAEGEGALPGPRCVHVTDSLFAGTLSAVMAGRKLSDAEHRVIFGLDRLLTALDRIDYLHREGFLDAEVEHPTVDYWVHLVGDRNGSMKPPEVQRALCEYVRRYAYLGALRLVEHYVPPTDRVPGCIVPAGGGGAGGSAVRDGG